MLIRIQKAPKGPDGKALGVNNVPPEKWAEMKILTNAPEYNEGVYSKIQYI